MFAVFEEEKGIAAGMVICLVSGIFLRVFLGLLYQKMIQDADNMASTGNKMLKQCKLKFANCFELSGGVSNIPVFVDKFLNRLSLGPLSFQMIYHLSGQLVLLSVVFSGVGVCRSIVHGKTLGEILPFYIVSFFGLYLFFSVSTVVDIRGKRRVLKINLVDYLENHLSPRIDVTKKDLNMLYGEAVFQEASGSVRQWDVRNRRRAGNAAVGARDGRTVELVPTAGKAGNGADKTVNTDRLDSMEEKISMDSEHSSLVTEEELEALLKEFLAT